MRSRRDLLKEVESDMSKIDGFGYEYATHKFASSPVGQKFYDPATDSWDNKQVVVRGFRIIGGETRWKDGKDATLDPAVENFLRKSFKRWMENKDWYDPNTVECRFEEDKQKWVFFECEL